MQPARSVRQDSKKAATPALDVPRDSFRVQPFEVAEQQPEITARRQTGPAEPVRIA